MSSTTVLVLDRLPREIREMIYELCLGVEGILVPYPKGNDVESHYDLKCPKPTVALLALNKQIRSEALPILYRENVWAITYLRPRSIPGQLHWRQALRNSLGKLRRLRAAGRYEVLPQQVLWQRCYQGLRYGASANT